MTETYINNLFADRLLKAGLQHNYALEIARTTSTFDVPSKVGQHQVTHDSFIAARHDDQFNAFERSWIAPLEEIS